MTREERVRRFMEIANEYNIGNSCSTWDELDKLSDSDLYNKEKLDEAALKIAAYYDRLENSKYRYPENIMSTIRQYHGMDNMDTSRDEEFGSYTPNEVFEIVTGYAGLKGCSYVIKNWINNIYGISLDAIK